MNSLNKQSTIRVAEGDESTPRIDFAYIDRKYKEWLVRRGFANELGNELGMRRANGRRGKRTLPDEI
mgnify:CR=1 FL=1|jgi:hypothetical protein